MRRHTRVAMQALLAGGCLLVWSGRAHAGEADDLQRMIDTHKTAAKALDSLDKRSAAKDEVAVLRLWLDEAWKLRADEDFDHAREILERCDAQEQMIQEKIAAAEVMTQAAEREAALKKSRDAVDKTKQAIAQAQIQKKALEMNAK